MVGLNQPPAKADRGHRRPPQPSRAGPQRPRRSHGPRHGLEVGAYLSDGPRRGAGRKLPHLHTAVGVPEREDAALPRAPRHARRGINQPACPGPRPRQLEPRRHDPALGVPAYCRAISAAR